MRVVMSRMIRLNHLQHGSIYLQITRGVARRDHKFPTDSWPAMVAAKHLASPPMPSQKGVAAITWQMKDGHAVVKQFSYCQIACKQRLPGKHLNFLMPDGSVSEESSSNVWIVNKAGELVARQ